jgi:hypothetical protein
VLSGEIALESRDGRPFRVLAAHGRPPQFVDFDPATDTPRARYTLRWDITAEHNAGTVPWFWVFETDHPEAPLVDVRVQHDSTRPDGIREPWVPKDQRLLLDHLRHGESVEAEAKLEYSANRRPEPASVRISGENSQFWAELISAVPDGQFLKLKLRVTPKPGARGLLYGTIQVTASGRTAPLRIIGTIVE